MACDEHFNLYPSTTTVSFLLFIFSHLNTWRHENRLQPIPWGIFHSTSPPTQKLPGLCTKPWDTGYFCCFPMLIHPQAAMALAGSRTRCGSWWEHGICWWAPSCKQAHTSQFKDWRW
jgi:hypothetical protein